MDDKFWIDRWERGETGWHQGDVNAELVAHIDALALGPKSRVLVPLCGASRDMAWLAKQGHEVIGIDVSRIGLEKFLAEHRVRHIETEDYGFRCYMGGRYQLLCGDFFRTPDEVFQSVDAVYDRASLIALPPEMRRRYADLMTAKLKPGTPTLLIALTYDPREMEGPPFSVPDREVKSLYAAGFDIRGLSSRDVLVNNEGLCKRGVTSLIESSYLLTRKA